MTAIFKALVIVVACIMWDPAISLYVVITLLRKLGLAQELRSQRKIARIGQSSADS